MSRQKTRRTIQPSVLTRALGLEGWAKLEPVVLAALAGGDPMLLVGSHGSAKSFLLERLAQALDLEYRFYNASLINFDDLIGIPVPNEDQSSLRYIATPTAIWDAEVVFVDELSRTRPELQNKLFPLIHERRVQGIDLPKLEYRWAAMNPPLSLDGSDEDERPDYLGSEPLDPALADRFVFVIEVPEWKHLRKEAKRRVLLDQFAGEHEFQTNVPQLVARARHVLDEVKRAVPSRLAEYLIAVESILRKKGAFLSARRMTMLLRAVLSIQAARVAMHLSGSNKPLATNVDWESSALLALKHGDPRIALGEKSSEPELLEVHEHAWKISGLAEDDPWRELLLIGDPLDRFSRALAFGTRLDDDDLGELILDAVGDQESNARRRTTALCCYLAVHQCRDVPATVIETLGNHARPALQPDKRTLRVTASNRKPSLPSLEVANRVTALVGEIKDQSDNGISHQNRYLVNLLESLLPDGYGDTMPAVIAELFRELWQRFHLDGVLSEQVER